MEHSKKDCQRVFVRNAGRRCRKKRKVRRSAKCVTLKSEILETNADLEREAVVIKRLCSRFSCEAIKLPIHQRLDYALTRKGIVEAFVEIKVRTVTSTTFDTAMIALDKVLAARQVAYATKKPVLLAIQWTDKLMFVDFAAGFSTKLGGRTDRNIMTDYGLVAHYNIGDFTEIK